MSRYAANTSVAADRSRNEIEATLTRWGASGFGYMWQGNIAVIVFQYAERNIKFMLEMPAKDDPLFTHTPGRNKPRRPEEAMREWEQATRQRWRALALVIKAKLEAVESKISTFENEFLANVVMANGDTVAQWVGPQLKQMYESKKMPPLLPGIGETKRSPVQ